MQGCSFAWDAEGAPLLSHIDLDVKQGQLVMVVGEVSPVKCCGDFNMMSCLWLAV